MSDKNKEAFYQWLQEMSLTGYKPKGNERKAWIDACEYKQKEIKKLKAENKKLRECVDWYIDLGLVEGYAENLLKKLK